MSLSAFQVHLILVFFIYGLSFFSMGLAMLLESGRSPLLADANVLRPLAVFGFVHGSHEWLEMALLLAGWLGMSIPVYYAWIRLLLLTFSFASLIAFGLFVLRPQDGFNSRVVYPGLGLLIVYAGLVVASILSAQHTSLDDWIQHADAFARYILAVPGALLACGALFSQSSEARRQGRPRLGLSLRLAALSFGLYSMTQIFVPALDIFPARYVNATAFLEWTGLPIQVVRALMAASITISLIRATQFAEDERKRQFLAVQQARLDALEQVQQELVKREALRRELLRHTVIAQEDERTRIARELHDETAQILTAFSLNVAAMRDQLVGQPKVADLLNRLQTLSKQMAKGIYRMVHDLRPAQLDDLGLAAALQYLSDQEHSNSGLSVDLVIDGPRLRLDPLVETVLFRVAQEALTNVSRYAEVNRAEVQLFVTPERVTLRICDQGVGFDVNEDLIPPKGWGLAGMRERAEAVGGQFTIQSSPGKGTIVEMIVPLLSIGTTSGGEVV
jgi:signal transduction histidine kinase